MPVRLEFLDELRTKALVPLNSYDQFGAIEGTIKFFISKELGEPGSWISIVNAAVLEAIMRGALIASGKGWMNDTGGNPGSVKWAAFFERMSRGRLIDRSVTYFSLSHVFGLLTSLADLIHVDARSGMGISGSRLRQLR